MSRYFPTTTRECTQVLEGINNELKRTIGEDRIQANKMEINQSRKEREAAAAAAQEVKPPPTAGSSIHPTVYSRPPELDDTV